MDSSYIPSENNTLSPAKKKREKQKDNRKLITEHDFILSRPKWFSQWHLLETMSLFIYRNSVAQGLENKPEHLSFLSYVDI